MVFSTLLLNLSLLFRPSTTARISWFRPNITGYSLSDQYILSPINPKYNDWFCQIYTNCSEIQNLQNCVLNFKTICLNLPKSVVIFWINWWQNMLICQRITCTYQASDLYPISWHDGEREKNSFQDSSLPNKNRHLHIRMLNHVSV